ncbi:MAG: hypothetical protein AVDCRST_MAG19-2606 [uncultured Thermomicrobiales bacterium]|uniref:Uncharacterized protein n=1 Tax=uncultured Thermomicrobiales bacterium TaxID=1645740 RepID=A0A6J4V4H9_9BACT|nr:MAG: hypothetical protein AVDCRST_MAG19-2606 [uncultured Thermomicrobiales bacterium]
MPPRALTSPRSRGWSARARAAAGAKGTKPRGGVPFRGHARGHGAAKRGGVSGRVRSRRPGTCEKINGFAPTFPEERAAPGETADADLF